MLRRLLTALDKPQYAFRPTQLVDRWLRALRPRTAGFETVRLPWGLSLTIRPGEAVADAIWGGGVHELALSEVLWRLTDPGDVACDVGAHVGYVSALLAARVGPRGRVLAFEPHPDLFAALDGNAARWRARTGVGPVEPVQAAVAENEGEGVLCVPSGFDENAGLAFLEQTGRTGVDVVATIGVRLLSLDGFFGGGPGPALLKIDAEGSEPAVLRGARGLLQRQEIRDVAFEDHATPPSPAMRLLEGMGYAVFRIERSFLGPRLQAAGAGPARHSWEPPNYLATRQPTRAQERMRARGWKVLRGG